MSRRFYSTIVPNFKEVKIPVPWGSIAGRWWNPSAKRPVLVVHGWQDNCGSFNRLIPHLNPQLGYLAIDLPGHGWSSHLPPGLFYNNLTYVILIQQICEFFQWSKVSLMGHSLGAICNYIYSTIFPTNVDFLICIDGIKPLQKKANVTRMADGLQELLKYNGQLQQAGEPPSYPLEALKQKVSAANAGSVQIEYSQHILDRNIALSKTLKDRYYFTRDPRLKSRLIINWPQKELLKGAENMTAPLLMFKFLDSGYFEDKKNFDELYEVLKRSSKELQFIEVEGGHHTHLNYPEKISGSVNYFIKKFDVEDRSVGGFSEELVYIRN